MPKCPKCHGAGFTLHQVAWSMDRVRILCKTCDGIGYTYRNVMTPTQRRQLANILLKEGEENWRVERESNKVWREAESDHAIDCYLFRYRAVRIDRTPTRTPLPIEHYKWGMEVTISEQNGKFLVIGTRQSTGWVIAVLDNSMPVSYYAPSRIAKWRWPNETEWKPAYTETVEEKIVETLIMEGL